MQVFSGVNLEADIDADILRVIPQDLEDDGLTWRLTARYDLGLLRPEGVVVLKSAVAGA